MEEKYILNRLLKFSWSQSTTIRSFLRSFSHKWLFHIAFLGLLQKNHHRHHHLDYKIRP